MPIEHINSRPSFGISCKPHVCRQIIRQGLHFNNADEIIVNLPYIGSNSTKLSKVKYAEKFWDNGEDCGAFTRAYLTFKMKGEKSVTTISTFIDSKDYSSTNIFPLFVEAVKEAEQKYITRRLRRAAGVGKLAQTLEEINKRFSNHADFIEQESSKLGMENRIANDIKREKAVKKQKIIDFFKNLFKINN